MERSSETALVQSPRVQAISSGITTGSPHELLARQETMAADFRVSRTPVREALRVLQATGMVEVVPNRGALVRGPTARDLREAYVLRAELEGFAAELAARWIRDDELAQLREAELLFQHLVLPRRPLDDDLELPRARGGGGRARPATRRNWMQANDRLPPRDPRGAGNSAFRRPSRTCTGASRAT